MRTVRSSSRLLSGVSDRGGCLARRGVWPGGVYLPGGVVSARTEISHGITDTLCSLVQGFVQVLSFLIWGTTTSQIREHSLGWDGICVRFSALACQPWEVCRSFSDHNLHKELLDSLHRKSYRNNKFHSSRMRTDRCSCLHSGVGGSVYPGYPTPVPKF